MDTKYPELPKCIKDVSYMLAENLEKAKDFRSKLRSDIDEYIKDLPEEQQEAAKKAIGTFGTNEDSEEKQEDILFQRTQLFIKNLFEELCIGDERIHNTFWLLGIDSLNETKNKLKENEQEYLADALGKFVFTFDDIPKLADRAIQRFLQEIDSYELAKALLHSKEETRQAIFKVLSERATLLLKSDMKDFQYVSKKDSQASQSTILSVIERLIALGDIQIPQFERIEENNFLNGD
jgi:hypothetical protein